MYSRHSEAKFSELVGLDIISSFASSTCITYVRLISFADSRKLLAPVGDCRTPSTSNERAQSPIRQDSATNAATMNDLKFHFINQNFIQAMGISWFIKKSFFFVLIFSSLLIYKGF